MNTFVYSTASSGLAYYVSFDGSAIVVPVTAVPEPSTWAMMLIGFAGLGYAAYCRQKKNAALVAG
jgi:hypothetical protein